MLVRGNIIGKEKIQCLGFDFKACKKVSNSMRILKIHCLQKVVLIAAKRINEGAVNNEVYKVIFLFFIICNCRVLFFMEPQHNIYRERECVCERIREKELSLMDLKMSISYENLRLLMHDYNVSNKCFYQNLFGKSKYTYCEIMKELT